MRTYVYEGKESKKDNAYNDKVNLYTSMKKFIPMYLMNSFLLLVLYKSHVQNKPQPIIAVSVSQSILTKTIKYMKRIISKSAFTN